MAARAYGLIAITATIVTSGADQCNKASQDEDIDSHIFLLQKSLSLSHRSYENSHLPISMARSATGTKNHHTATLVSEVAAGCRLREVLGEHLFSLMSFALVHKRSVLHDSQPETNTNITSQMPFESERVPIKFQSTRLSPIAAVLTACFTMLTIGGDDVIWLLPFFIGKDKVVKTVFYILYMEIVVVGSWLLKDAMVFLEKEHPQFPTRKIVQVVSAICLTLFCAFLFKEWMSEEENDDDELTISKLSEESVGGGSTPAAAGGNEDSMSPSSTIGHNEHHERLGLWMLFVVSMLGSMDNFAVFSYLMLADVFTGFQLLCGVLLASSIISAVAHGALAFKPLLSLVEKMPLWIIFAILSVWSYIQILRD